MRLSRVRIRDYRSIHDTGWFEIEDAKTILVGPNEAGKTAILLALEAINPPKGKGQFDWLRDYPRSRLNDIQSGRIQPAQVTVAEAVFKLDDQDREILARHHPKLKSVTELTVGSRLDNTRWYRLEGGPKIPSYAEIKKDLLRLKSHLGDRAPADLLKQLEAVVSSWADQTLVNGDRAKALTKWLDAVLPHIDEQNSAEEERHSGLLERIAYAPARDAARNELSQQIPSFVYFSNYFQVRPSIHLRHLANRLASGILDDEAYDFGNKCLLQLLGFTAQELADLGDATEPQPNQPDSLKRYRDQLDKRHYSLNAAQVYLTEQIQDVWVAEEEDERLRLRLHADKQYLKVVVEDELGVEVELDQRSAGFQWLVSFFIVFRAQAEDEYDNAILLLDEPGLSLHGLKQRQFRKTVSKIAVNNQTIYTTHSPFMVGPDELPIVRVVEMTDRKTGTKVHTQVSADDPRSLFPLQEALGYDLAQSLFAHQRNLVCEGLTDYWYLDGMATLLREAGIAKLNQKIAFVPANTAAKVVYYATILHSQRLKVAALLDSDQAGEKAATQDNLVILLGQKRILRTKDAYSGLVARPEIEDLLRDTLVRIAKDELGWDVSATAQSQEKRSIASIFEENIPSFSKYKLAKTFLRWIATHDASEFTPDELGWWSSLFEAINKALR